MKRPLETGKLSPLKKLRVDKGKGVKARPPDPPLSSKEDGMLLQTMGHRVVVSGPVSARPSPDLLDQEIPNLLGKHPGP